MRCRVPSSSTPSMIAASGTGRMSRSAHFPGSRRLSVPAGPATEQLVLVGERHLGRQLAGPEPAQLLDVVGGRGLAVAADEPRQPEHEGAVVGLDMRAEELERFDLDPRLLAELAPEAVDRVLALLEKPARDVPEPLPRLSLPARQQHLPVALEEALGRRRRVRPVAGAAGSTAGMAAVEAGELAAAAWAEPPAVEDAHGARIVGARRYPSHASASTASASRGHASFAQSPKPRSLRQASASPASGSTQRKPPARPKWPNVRGEFAVPVQCGALASRSSMPSPQSFGVIRPNPGQACELDTRGLRQRLLREAPRVEQLPRDVEQGAERCLDACCR